MQKQNITNAEITNQLLCDLNDWYLVFPKKPISSYHFLLIPNRNDVSEFTELTATELEGMKKMVSFLIEKIENKKIKLNGYNLFSNNGTYEIGQHLSRFHQHIFVRTQDELESPYTVMSEGRRWAEVGSSEWEQRRDELRVLFNIS